MIEGEEEGGFVSCEERWEIGGRDKQSLEEEESSFGF